MQYARAYSQSALNIFTYMIKPKNEKQQKSLERKILEHVCSNKIANKD